MDAPLMEGGSRDMFEMSEVDDGQIQSGLDTISHLRPEPERAPRPVWKEPVPSHEVGDNYVSAESPAAVSTRRAVRKEKRDKKRLFDAESSETPEGVGCCSFSIAAIGLMLLGGIILGVFLILMILVIIMFVEVMSIASGNSSGMSDMFQDIGEVKNIADAVNTGVKDVDSAIHLKFPVGKTYGALPMRVALDWTKMTPVKFSSLRDPSWMFATIALLESSYRKYGVQAGFLADTDYVKFSEQAFGKRVLEYCTAPAQESNALCSWGNTQNGSLSNGYAEFLFLLLLGEEEHSPLYVDFTSGAVYPYSICPYNASEPDLCPNAGSQKDVNPLSFTVQKTSQANLVSSSTPLYMRGDPVFDYAFTVEGIKEKLWMHGEAATLQTKLMMQNYRAPCDENQSGMQTIANVCSACDFPCSDSSDGCCFEIILPGYDHRGVFYVHGDPLLDGGFTELLVGYTDLFRADLAVAGAQSSSTNYGGFIVKNTLGWQNGHSMGYWLQEWSAEQEKSICPCPNDPSSWSALNPACIANGTALSSVDPMSLGSCSPYTVLRCTFFGEHAGNLLGLPLCDPLYYYVVADSEAEVGFLNKPPLLWVVAKDDSDKIEVKMYRFLISSPSGSLETFMVNSTTLASFSTVFENVGTVNSTGGISPAPQNNEEFCGLYFLPYSVFEESSSRWGGGWATWYDINWHTRSYLSQKGDFQDFNYDFVQSSTCAQRLPNVTDPISSPMWS